MWIILRGKLPGKLALFKSVNCQPICNLCHQHYRSIDHLFIQCECSKALWFVSPLGITTEFMHDAPISFVELIKSIIMHGDNETNKLIMTICNEIWFVRNKRCFEGIKVPDPVVSLRRACKRSNSTIILK